MRKFGDNVVAVIKKTVDENSTFNLKQIKRAVEEQLLGFKISTRSVDHLHDAHNYSIKSATQRPMDRNHSDVKRKRLRTLAAERWAPGVPALQTTSVTKGANINIVAFMSGNGVLHWHVVESVHWSAFNEFLADVSALTESEEPGTEAVLIFDNAPAHNNAEQEISPAQSIQSIFHPIEEVFATFKGIVKGYLSDPRDEVLATPQGVTKKEHRSSLLAALREEDM
ncbi:hypothetical protein HPB50_003185 [Hyalomma asiaticum]|uniref:Uncharacterized protein n=1 Tax=Hyalomma asiaticum TaxID=266040 RepID=A0ACB7T5U1_HYAAI|nr:hypothetical protein HPB50_003185 [Hyalomma asiaticum]